MKLRHVEIENYRAIGKLNLSLDPHLTVFHGENAHGKTSVLSAIAVGLGRISKLLPGVSDIGFLKTDQRPLQSIQIALTTVDGIAWQEAAYGRRSKFSALREATESMISADREGSAPHDLPLAVFYDANRAVFDQPRRRRGFTTEFPRYAAMQGALAARTDFREFFKWFYAKENEELRWQRDLRDLDYRIKDLNAVRKAIKAVLLGASDPHIKHNPLRFVVSVESKGGGTETLSIDQLSGGYRIVLALAADLARRMAQGNPHLDDPLQSEAVVLIDEIELHLHPAWQQRILPDLLRTFPNAQFIVSTHSPQVLTTVKPEQVIELYREDGNIVAGSADAPIYGAEAGGVLAAVMGVSERPRKNPFVKKLDRYMELVGSGAGESEEARSLRRELDEDSPDDPGLDRADVEIRRRKVLSGMGKSA